MNIKTEMIHYPSNGHTTPGYLARPAGPGEYPAIVVIQEWWGLVGHIKDVAERFAREGYVALAPDLYHGQAAEEPDEARKLAMALDRERAVAEIAAAARHLKHLETTAPRKVGTVGWCMGGGLSLSAAAHNGDIAATVCFYGRPLDAADTARLKAPVLGLYAEEDQGIPPSAARAFERELEAAGVPHDIHVYPGTHHGFFNDTRAGIYHAEAAADAWRRTLDWFRWYLQ